MLSTLAIGVQVCMILTLEGLSHGMLEDQAQRSRGIGADIVIRASTATFLSLGEAFTDKYLPLFVRKQRHVVLATGALVRPTGPLTTVTGLDLPEFERMSGSFRFLAGGIYRKPDDVIVDEYYARQYHLRVGDTMQMLNRRWRVSGIFEQGKIARLIVPLGLLQDLTSNTGKINVIYVKLDNPAHTQEVIESLRAGMENFKIYSMEELQSLYTVKNVPMLPEFTGVVIGLGVVVGFLVVFLSMYTAVLERTREIGVLKALGASPGFVLNVLVRETTLLAVLGSALGILLTYGTRWLIMTFWPGSLIQAIVPEWWPIAAGIAIAGALLGAAWPGLKAARQDAIEALSYE